MTESDTNDEQPLDDDDAEGDESSASWWSDDEEEAETAGSRRKVVVYVRVSSAKQAEGGLSLEAQRSRLLALCEALELEVVEVVEEVCSTGVD